MKPSGHGFMGSIQGSTGKNKGLDNLPNPFIFMVRPGRFELPTSRFVVGGSAGLIVPCFCLSYKHVVILSKAHIHLNYIIYFMALHRTEKYLCPVFIGNSTDTYSSFNQLATKCVKDGLAGALFLLDY